MRGRLLVFIILGVGLVFAVLFTRELYLAKSLPREKFESKKLTVLTYSTFVSANGPGSRILDQFKAAHGCELNVIVVGDSGLLLPRLKLTPGIDVVIGLDQFMLKGALELGTYRKIEISHAGWTSDLPTVDSSFVPFDWSPLTFIYRKGTEPPKDFADLLNPRFKNQFAIQDPRTSSPGLDLQEWIKSVEGDKAKSFSEAFQANVQSTSPNWAYSYGLFKDHKAQFVFSYVTSLAFHWGLEKDLSYQAVSFPEGHPVQVEYMAVPATCKECALGEDLVRAFLTPEAQKLIMEKNFMLPVLSSVETGTIYEKLPHLKVRP